MSQELKQNSAAGAPASSWKPYPAYKDSGVEWLGRVPEHWELRKISRSFSLIGSGATPESGNKKYYENGVMPWVNTGDLNDSILESCEKKITHEAFEKYTALKIYPRGTILMAMYGATIGKVSLLNFEVCTNQACCALGRSSFFIDKFAFYWFLANKRNIVNLSFGGGQPNISQEIIKSLKLTCPPIEEQHAISLYLDDRTWKIDSLIEKKQKMIELLKEERAAVINQAVTKGLNPDAQMKDSGIEWLGEVPEHWNVVGLTKYLESIVDYRGRAPPKVDSGVFLVTARNIKNGKIDYSLSEEYIDLEEHKKVMQRGLPINGDVLFTTEAPLGEVANVDKEFIALAQRIIKFRANKNYLNNYFLKFWLMSYSFQSDLHRYATGSTALGIKASKLNNLKVVLPTLPEQQAIVKFIESETAQIDLTISRIDKEILLLQEYRTALISEVVTGKINVREAI